MSVTLPEFAWTRDRAPRIEQDAEPAVLLSLALAYHTAQYGMSFASESAARDLFLRMRPINDADMREWMAAWETLLAAQMRQQAYLTSAYIANTLQRFGIELVESIDRDLAALADLEQMMESRVYALAPSGLRAEIRDAARRLGAGGARLDDLLLADRVQSLASPVVKVRTATAGGATLDEAVRSVVPDVEGMTFDFGRSAERIAMRAAQWPAFKNGQAMLYRRVITPGACGWCAIVATRLYAARSAKGSAVWHRGCRCTWQLVSEADATAYAKKLKDSDGDYFAAAREAGLWTGDAPASSAEFIRTRRATDGSTGGNGAGAGAAR